MSPLNITVVGWLIIFILIFKIPPTIKRDRKANPVNLSLKFKMTTASEFTNPSVLLVAAPAYFEKKRFLLWRTADVRISHEEMLNSSAATQKAFSILRHGMEIMNGWKLKVEVDNRDFMQYLDSPIQKSDTSDISLVAVQTLFFVQRIKCSQGCSPKPSKTHQIHYLGTALLYATVVGNS